MLLSRLGGQRTSRLPPFSRDIVRRTMGHYIVPKDLTERPADWKSAAPYSPGDKETSRTYGSTLKLPRLPVPKLEDTTARLKETLRPHAYTAEEYAEAERKIDPCASGLGPELQKRLLKRAEGREHWPFCSMCVCSADSVCDQGCHKRVLLFWLRSSTQAPPPNPGCPCSWSRPWRPHVPRETPARAHEARRH